MTAQSRLQMKTEKASSALGLDKRSDIIVGGGFQRQRFAVDLHRLVREDFNQNLSVTELPAVGQDPFPL